MMALLHYLYQNNKKKMFVALLLFILMEVVILVNMNLVVNHSGAMNRQIAMVILLIITYVIMVFLVFIQSMLEFKKMLQSPLIRLTPVRGIHYITSVLLLYIIGVLIISILGIIGMNISATSVSKSTDLYMFLHSIQKGSISQYLLINVVEIFSGATLLVQALFSISLAKMVFMKKRIEYILASS